MTRINLSEVDMAEDVCKEKRERALNLKGIFSEDMKSAMAEGLEY